MILFGKQIKTLRNKYKLTQTELANRVGVTKSTIAAYENDSRQPSYEVLIKLSRVFNISIDALILNHTEIILDVHDLNTEQIDIINSLISYFRRTNRVEESFSNLQSPELMEHLTENININK